MPLPPVPAWTAAKRYVETAVTLPCSPSNACGPPINGATLRMASPPAIVSATELLPVRAHSATCTALQPAVRCFIKSPFHATQPAGPAGNAVPGPRNVPVGTSEKSEDGKAFPSTIGAKSDSRTSATIVRGGGGGGGGGGDGDGRGEEGEGKGEGGGNWERVYAPSQCLLVHSANAVHHNPTAASVLPPPPPPPPSTLPTVGVAAAAAAAVVVGTAVYVPHNANAPGSSMLLLLLAILAIDLSSGVSGYLRHHDASSECATARQHKCGNLLPNPKRTLVGCNDPPSLLPLSKASKRGSAHPHQCPRVNQKKNTKIVDESSVVSLYCIGRTKAEASRQWLRRWT